ncbi:hypothetical protein KEM54_001439, partial [Ascosphaera aggregata]
MFICHSLGGLIVKSALLVSAESKNGNNRLLKPLYLSAHSIIFLATPHWVTKGVRECVNLQSVASSVSRNLLINSQRELTLTLQGRSKTLKKLDKKFQDLLSRLRVACFYEMQPTAMLGTKKIVVDIISAAPPELLGSCEVAGIAANHQNISRFSSKDDDGFRMIVDAVLRFTSAAMETVPHRWNVALSHQEDQPNPNEVRPRLVHYSEFKSNTPMFTASLDCDPESMVFGRGIQLEKLRRHLLDQKEKPWHISSVLIHSEAGMGKSCLARQYICRYWRSYPNGVFWVDARGISTCKDSYFAIADQLVRTVGGKDLRIDAEDPGSYISMVRQWLERKDDWLLVFDGIAFSDKSFRAFKQFVPLTRKASIIYTSRDEGLSKKTILSEPLSLKIGPLEKEFANKILYNGLHIETPTKDQNVSASCISNLYKCRPLPIKMTANLLKAVGIALEDYRAPTGEPSSTEKTFFQMLQHLESQPGTLFLVNVLSFFDFRVPLKIPQWGASLLTKYWHGWQASDRSEDVGDFSVNSAIETMVRYGLAEKRYVPFIHHSDGQRSRRDETSTDVPDPESQTPDGILLFPRVEYLDLVPSAQAYARSLLEEKGGKFEWWLGLAVMMFNRAYQAALHTSRDSEESEPFELPSRELREFKAIGT